MHHYGYASEFGFWSVLGHALIVLLIIWVVIRLISGPGRWRRWGAGGFTHWQSGMSILNERFAKGEIDKAEYEERKKAILGQG